MFYNILYFYYAVAPDAAPSAAVPRECTSKGI